MPAAAPLRLSTLAELRQFVHRTLFEENDFEPGAFRITEYFLTRRGEPCGLYFCLHGPRSVKLTAIWETDAHSILFYDAGGQRIRKLRLAAAPRLAVAS